MPNYLVRPAAREDLEQIWHYTVEIWGPDQADAYLAELFGGFELLAESPHLGRDASEIRAGYRQHSVGKHVVFYRADADAIDIVRVLHERMLPDRHL